MSADADVGVGSPDVSAVSVPQGGRPVPTLEQFLEGLRSGGILADVQKVKW